MGAASRGMMESFGVFVLPIGAALGVERGAITGIYGLSMLALGAGAPLAGFLIDRLGARAVVTGGALLLALSVGAGSAAAQLWQLQAAIGLGVGLAGAALGATVQAAILARWYRERLASALAISFSANGVGAILLGPLAQALVDHAGFRYAYGALGLGFLALAVPLLFLPWKRIEAGAVRAASAHGRAGPTLNDALGAPAFWLLATAFFFTSVGIYSLAPQVVAYLIERGLAPLAAASAYGFASLLVPIGMIGIGWLADRAGRRLALVIAYGSSIAGVASLAAVAGPASLAALYGFIVLFGATMGSRGPVISSLAARHFGGASLGAIHGVLTLAMGLGGAAGAWAGGALQAALGYGAVFWLSALGLAAGAASLIAAPDAPRRG